eukprot:TRINITY_DN17024_c0_g1_i1.p1 TRINITY_DN17024_c0_g1~~TRINITY_DN17024_c0_g1_i1.p1  ORF type:complete len:278 (-),score=85.85 TRINITY_DN17024_c0_g1_i1:108-941(-)
MLNLTRTELKTKINELYKASKLPSLSESKVDFTSKQFREKLDKGYTWDQYIEDYGHEDAKYTLPGVPRYDDLIRNASGLRYPKPFLDLVGGSKETTTAFNQFDQALADLENNFDKQMEENFLQDMPYKNLDMSKLDWGYIYRNVPRYQHHYVDVIKESLDEVLPEPSLDHILELFDEEEEEINKRFDKEAEFIQKRIDYYQEEVQRSYDFYEKLPTMTGYDLFEMDPELFQLALDDFERKIDTVAWDPLFEATQEQQKEDEFIKAALDLKTLPELPN